MSLRKKMEKKKKFLLQKNGISFIIPLNKELYSEKKVRKGLRQVDKIEFRTSSRKGYFILKAKTSNQKDCLELMNCVFSLHC